jgi:hypothetical protein
MQRMRASTALLAALVLCGLIAGPPVGAAHPRRAELSVTRMSPVTVHGSGFRRAERVRLVMRSAATRVVRRVTAGPRGAFTTTFAGINLGRCGGFSIAATGSAGSRASVIRHVALPACYPA